MRMKEVKKALIESSKSSIEIKGYKVEPNNKRLKSYSFIFSLSLVLLLLFALVTLLTINHFNYLDGLSDNNCDILSEKDIDYIKAVSDTYNTCPSFNLNYAEGVDIYIFKSEKNTDKKRYLYFYKVVTKSIDNLNIILNINNQRIIVQGSECGLLLSTERKDYSLDLQVGTIDNTKRYILG